MNLTFLVNYVRSQKCYFYFLMAQLALILTLVIYVFAGFDQSRHTERNVLIIEFSLTSFIIVEILMKIALNKREFFRNIWNIIDVCGVSLIIALFAMLLTFEAASSTETEEDDLIPAVLLTIRYVIQVAKILFNLKQYHIFRHVTNLDIIFDNDKSIQIAEMADTQPQSIEELDV